MHAQLFDDGLRPASDAEWQAALDGDPELRRVVGEVNSLERCENNPLLTEEGERVLVPFPGRDDSPRQEVASIGFPAFFMRRQKDDSLLCPRCGHRALVF